MDKFIIEQIIKAFDRCYGLKSALQRAVNEKDDLLLTESIDSLAYQSGVRKGYIQNHINEIILL